MDRESYNRLLNRFAQVLSLFATYEITIEILTGPPFTVRVSSDMSVYDVKVILAARYDNIPEVNHLYFNNHELEDDRTLEDLDIFNYAVLTDTMTIYLLRDTGSRVISYVNPEQQIRDLVDEFSTGPLTYPGIPVERHRVIYNGKRLDLNRQIKDYSIKPDDVIQIMRP